MGDWLVTVTVEKNLNAVQHTFKIRRIGACQSRETLECTFRLGHSLDWTLYAPTPPPGSYRWPLANDNETPKRCWVKGGTDDEHDAVMLDQRKTMHDLADHDCRMKQGAAH